MTNTRGTFGFIKFSDESKKRAAVIEHIFVDGRLLVHYSGNQRFRAILDPEELFEASRDAYWTEGSWVEPEWDGDSARCLNYWAQAEANGAVNVMTDEQAEAFFERV